MNKQPDFRIFWGLAGVTMLVGGLMVYSAWSGLGAQQEAVDKVQKQVNDASGVKRQEEASEAKLAEIRTKLAHLEKGVPDYRYIPGMLKELEQFGNMNGIHVIGVRPLVAKVSAKPDEKETRKPYDELGLEVKGRGTYGDALRFVKALRQFPKIVAARTVTLQPRSSSSSESGLGSPTLELTIELKVFVFPEEKAATDDKTKQPPSTVAATGVTSNG